MEKLTTSSNGQTYQYKYNSKVKTKHYDLSFKPNQEIQRVKFDNNYRIHGSQNWKGERYAAFRNYDNEWHDRGWWHSRYKRIAFFSGGWYLLECEPLVSSVGLRSGCVLRLRRPYLCL